MFKRFLSGLTGMAIAFSMFGMIPVSAEDTAVTPETQAEVVNDDYEVKGTNSLGDMLAEKLSAEVANDDAGEGSFAISDVTVNGKTATVEYGVVKACTLVVGIFDEDKTTMLGSGTLEIPEGNGKTDVEINIDTMPQYFYVKAFLIDSMTYRPLREAFTSDTYTKKMQDFLALTTDDFDSEKVLNLDDDKTNNFMVFKDEVIVLDDSDGELVTDEDTTADEDEISGEAKTYTFKNAGDRIKSLKKGDIFTIGDIENIVIAKVGSISVDGDTVVITEDDIEMEDVFGHIRIDTSNQESEIEMDESTLGEGVTYLGKTRDSENTDEDTTSSEINTIEQGLNAIGPDYDDNVDCHFRISNHDGDRFNIEAYVKLQIGVELTVNYSFWDDIFEVDFNSTISTGVEGEIEIKLIEKKFLSLGNPSFPIPNTGLEIVVKCDLVFEGKLKVNSSLEINRNIHLYHENGRTFNYSSPIAFSGVLNAELRGFIGLKIEVKIQDIIERGKILSMGVGAEFGVNLTAILKTNLSGQDTYGHSCSACLSGTLKPALILSAEINFLRFSCSYEHECSSEAKKNFHYSFDYHEFGWGECNHKNIKYLFSIMDKKDHALKDAHILLKNNETNKSAGGKTNNRGNLVLYAAPGDVTITVTKDGYEPLSKDLGQVGEDIFKLYKLKKIKKPSSSSSKKESSSSKKDSSSSKKDSSSKKSSSSSKKESSSSKSSSSSSKPNSSSASSSPDSSSSVPATVNPNAVKQVSAGVRNTACVTEDGSLYVWGDNAYGQIGNGTSNTQATPLKIWDNVKQVSVGHNHIAFITNDGSLYACGVNAGKLGDGTTDNRWTPVKVMDNVKQVSAGYDATAIVTEDGSLYTCGFGVCMGFYCPSPLCTPTKIMENVKQVDICEFHGACVTEDGSLYTWGSNSALGTGDNTIHYEPVKVMENVKEVCTAEYNTACITENGDLYICGDNSKYQIGDFTNETSLYFKRIRSGVKKADMGYEMGACITDNNNLYVWGNRYHGKLGVSEYLYNEDINDCTYSPFVVMHNISQISIGYNHTTCVSTNGELFVTGDNIHRQTGMNGSDGGDFSNVEGFSQLYIPVSNTVSQNLNADAVNTEKTEVKSDSFANLKANCIYNVYAFNSEDMELTNDDIAFIDQFTTDKNGVLPFDRASVENSDKLYWMAVPMDRTDISSAEVKINDLEYNGEEQYVEPVVTLGGNVLEEGTDYYLTDDFCVTEVGKYKVTVCGTGMYKGSVSVEFSMIGKAQALGDINGDGAINVTDIAMVAAHIKGIKALDENAVKVADVNKDDAVNVTDIAMIAAHIKGIKAIA